MREINENFLRVDVANLELIVRQLIAEYPELADDEDLLQDMLEGSTDFDGVLSRLVGLARLAKANQDACKALREDMVEREKRWEKKDKVARQTMLRLMQLAAIPKRKLPEATISLVAPRLSVTIADPALIPDEFVEMARLPVPSKIKEALQAGTEVPGAQLVPGPQGLMIR